MITKELTAPMHWPTHGQWWSNLWTQLLQMEQWEARGDRYNKQVSQNLTWTVSPVSNFTSLILGSLRVPVLPFAQSNDVDLHRSSSSDDDSGGFVFLGIIPGSPKLVRNKKPKSCNNNLSKFTKQSRTGEDIILNPNLNYLLLLV